MRQRVKHREKGADGSVQIIVQDMPVPWDNDVDQLYIETRVNGIIYRAVRRNGQIVGTEMIDGQHRRYGPHDEIHVWDDTKLDEAGSAIRNFYLSPNKRWLYQDQRIVAHVDVARIDEVLDDRLAPVLFQGLRLDEYLLRLILRRVGWEPLEKKLEARVPHFKRWPGHDHIQVLMASMMWWAPPPEGEGFGRA